MKPKTPKNEANSTSNTERLREQLLALHMTYMVENFESLGQKAALEQSAHIDYLAKLIDGESCRRDDRSVERRIAAARLPVPKTLEQFDWSWPAHINQLQVRHLFRLDFLKISLKTRATSFLLATSVWVKATSRRRWHIAPA